jgi:tRNA (cytidine32/uridine32-2'-O)-methyltransferase
MDPDHVDVVLVRPARAGNVAAACRAMKNMGLRRLLLVDAPPLDHPDDTAQAYGAWELLDQAVRHATLADAVAGSTFVAGTSGRAGPEAWSPRQLATQGAERAGTGRTSLVFGPESSGLERDELRLCHVVIRIPAHPDQPSLNLAQAVLILAYEIRLSDGRAPAAAPGLDRADAGELEACLAALQDGLLSIGYLKPPDPGRILGEIRGLLARAAPTRRELSLLRGMARQIRWAGSVAERAPSGG